VSIRVLVVDDQVLVRTGFRLILEANDDVEVVGEAGDGAEAVRQVARTTPDVVLMDVRMPVMDGIEATRRIVAEQPAGGARVVMLTTFDLDEYVFDALRAGASGFLLKDVGRDELLRGVRVVAAGDALLAPSVTRRLIEDYATRADGSSRSASGGVDRPSLARSLEPLTGRERETLDLLAEGLSNAEIAERMYVSEATVKTHVAHVLMKLHLRDRVQAVVFAYESGLVRPTGP
jgi:DNA-binding NarL/FixJ family response regulator